MSHPRRAGLRRLLLAGGFCLAGWCALAALHAPPAGAATTHDQPAHGVLRDVGNQVDALSGSVSGTLALRDQPSADPADPADHVAGEHADHATESRDHAPTTRRDSGSTSVPAASGRPSLLPSSGTLLDRVVPVRHSSEHAAPAVRNAVRSVADVLAAPVRLAQPVRSTLHLTPPAVVTTAVTEPVRGAVHLADGVPAEPLTGRTSDGEAIGQSTVGAAPVRAGASMVRAIPNVDCPPGVDAAPGSTARSHTRGLPVSGSIAWPVDGNAPGPTGPGSGALPGSGTPLAPGTGGTGTGHASCATEAHGCLTAVHFRTAGRSQTPDERPLGNDSGEPQVSPD